jgi:hypothetical protein
MKISYFPRNAYQPWIGKPCPWPRDVAGRYSDGTFVTWSEIHAHRKKRQHEQLERRRFSWRPQKFAALLEVRDYGDQILGGWHIRLRTLQTDFWAYECDWVFTEACRLFPLPLRLYPVKRPCDYGRSHIRRIQDIWAEWFATNHQTGIFNDKPSARALLWMQNHKLSMPQAHVAKT